jgi:hypothetical protein
MKEGIFLSLSIVLFIIFIKIPLQIESVFLSAFISWLISSRNNQTKLVFDLHTEFNTKEMYEARRVADKFLKDHSDINFKEIYEKYDEKDSRPIWLVVRFYERLWLIIDNNQANLELIPKLFGETFYWWYINSFKEQLLPISIQASDHIKNLKNWIDKKAEEKDRKEWEKSAEEDKERRKTQCPKTLLDRLKE